MGLYAYIEDTGTEAWYGAYSAFSRWRDAIATAAGYDTDPIDWDQITSANLAGVWETAPVDPLLVLIAHSDCDGEIQPEHAGPLADRIEEVAPRLPEGSGGGHVGDWQATTAKFVAALRESAKSGRKVVFS